MENFKELNLSPALATAIEELGYTAPTPVQAETLPILLAGPTDFLGLAATGTGKTAAFGIPLLEQLNASRHEIQALIICPTRELAQQVSGQINLLGKHKKLRSVPIYGGAGYGDQLRALRAGVQIVVATPGRLIDHLERGTVKLDKIKTVILDEADEMISMGFKDEIEKILESVPTETCNTWLFSATMSKEVRRVADRFLKNPKTVQVNNTQMLSSNVRQIYYKAKETDKPDILCKLIDVSEDFYGLIFCQTKSLVADLTTLLTSRGYKVDCLHGDKDQMQRERTMRAFRERKVSILVCTDVACRGLDVKDLTHVINYSIPRELDNYVHRIGRTARSGKSGLALSLVTMSHMQLVGRIEKMTKSKMEQGVVPTRRDIGIKKVSGLLARFQAVESHKKVEDLLDAAWQTTLEGMSKQEIAARLLTLTFADTFVENDKSASMQMPGKPTEQGYGFERGGRDRAPRFGGERDRPAYGAGRDVDYTLNHTPSVTPLATPIVNARYGTEAPVSRPFVNVKPIADFIAEALEPQAEPQFEKPVSMPVAASEAVSEKFIAAESVIAFETDSESESEMEMEMEMEKGMDVVDAFLLEATPVSKPEPKVAKVSVKVSKTRAASSSFAVKPLTTPIIGGSTGPWGGERRPEARRRGARPFGSGSEERPRYEDNASQSERPRFGDRGPRRDDRPSYGDRPRPSYGNARPSYGDRPQRRDDQRPSYGDRPRRDDQRPSYGDRPRRDDRPSYGDSAPYAEKQLSSFGTRVVRADSPSYGDRPRRDDQRPSYGDRPQRHDDRPNYGDRPRKAGYSSDKKKSFGAADGSGTLSRSVRPNRGKSW